MCGIAGFLDPGHRLDPGRYDAVAGAMADAIAHRGPDDSAVWSDAQAGIALGFRRLAILDLSPAGRQPMHSPDGDLVLAFNGEIYNHRTLRAELSPGRATPWRGHSDTEVLLEAIAQWGFVAALARLNGMFAIVLWDRRARLLRLARDRLGEKPLYYGWSNGVFLFASELKALARHPAWSGAIDRAALGLFLRHAYVPAPWSIYASMRKLPPGASLAIAAGGEEVPCVSYWHAAERAAAAAASPFRGGEAAANEELQALVDDAVAVRMEADVPLGAFLSGGIDSATVVAAMQKARPGAVRTFCVGFPDAGFDESAEAEAVARHLGTEHSTLKVSEPDCIAAVARMASIYDEPFADPSQIPTFVLCQETRTRVTVSVSGDGGDELFGGYDRYFRAAAEWRRQSTAPAPLRHGARALTRLLAGSDWHLARRLRKLAAPWARATPEALYRDHLSRWRSEDGLAPGLGAAPCGFDEPLAAGIPSLEQAFMLRDVTTYLPDDLLVKIDRASMACGLEVRAPLIDHRIAEFAWSLPPALLVTGASKRLLREALYRRVPRALVDRPKHGFEPPLARWLMEALRPWADDLLSRDRLRRHGLVDPGIVAARWSAHRAGRRNWALALWPVIMLEAWLGEREAVAPAPRLGRMPEIAGAAP
jgi:asparagine synthase (glutamine-hydrolysing)